MSGARTVAERLLQRIPTRHRMPQAVTYARSEDLPVEGAWTAATLQNSWVNYDSANYANAQYRKDGSIVSLRGVIKDGTASANTLLFTLPAGYRPTKRHVFAVVADGAIEVIDVLANGEVRLMTASSSTYLSLCTLTFRTD